MQIEETSLLVNDIKKLDNPEFYEDLVLEKDPNIIIGEVLTDEEHCQEIYAEDNYHANSVKNISDESLNTKLEINQKLLQEKNLKKNRLLVQKRGKRTRYKLREKTTRNGTQTYLTESSKRRTYKNAQIKKAIRADRRQVKVSLSKYIK